MPFREKHRYRRRKFSILPTFDEMGGPVSDEDLGVDRLPELESLVLVFVILDF